MSQYVLNPQYRPPHFIHFGVPDIVIVTISLLNIQCWALEQGVQWNFHHHTVSHYRPHEGTIMTY